MNLREVNNFSQSGDSSDKHFLLIFNLIHFSINTPCNIRIILTILRALYSVFIRQLFNWLGLDKILVIDKHLNVILRVIITIL